MPAGLLDVGRGGYLRPGKRALGGLADTEARRNRMEEQMDAADQARQMQTAGMGAGIGMQAGAAGGPAGMAAGAVGGGLAGYFIGEYL